MSELLKPSKIQMDWLDAEFGIFVHFSINTFANKEWSNGTYSPQIYNPKSLDCEQWVRVASEIGAKYMVLVCKHHDGFCNWQTDTTEYSVKNSPWKGGKGDVVREFVAACRKYGMKIGFYLSPWDRHEPKYHDKAAYDQFYAAQLTELVTKYVNHDELFYMWFDGAGSAGRVYDWKLYMDILHKHQPHLSIFGMGDFTSRWVGNEDGFAPYPNWNVITHEGKQIFAPAECDVPIRHFHWFHHSGLWGIAYRLALFKKDKLVELYEKSVGHGANLLLNLAPTKLGLFNETDVKRVREFAEEIKRRYNAPIAETKGKGKEIILNLPTESRISATIIQEDLSEGELIRKYTLEAKTASGWKVIPTREDTLSVGHKKIDIFSTPMVTSSIRLTIQDSLKEPIIRSFRAFTF